MTDFYGQTALHHAAEYGQSHVVQILINAGLKFPSVKLICSSIGYSFVCTLLLK